MFQVSEESLIMDSLALASCSAFSGFHGTAAEACIVAARAIPEPYCTLQDGITSTPWDLAIVRIRSKAVNPPPNDDVWSKNVHITSSHSTIPSQSTLPSHSCSPQTTGTEGLSSALECGAKASTNRETLADDIAQTNFSAGTFELWLWTTMFGQMSREPPGLFACLFPEIGRRF